MAWNAWKLTILASGLLEYHRPNWKLLRPSTTRMPGTSAMSSGEVKWSEVGT